MGIAAIVWMRRADLSVWVIDVAVLAAFAVFAVGVFDIVLMVRRRSSL